MKFEPLQITKISELVEADIKRAVLNQKLKPGDKLPTEKQMAQQFGVSIVTLREALRALEIIGLIEKKKGQGGGVFISEIGNESIKNSLGHYLSFKDLSHEHLYEVRKIIEPSAIRLAVQKISTDEIEKIEENVLYCEQKLGEVGPLIGEKDFFELDDRNNTFHQLIANATHNPILSLTIDYILDFLEGCETTLLVPDFNYTSKNIMDHRNILEHLKRRDVEKCEQEMIVHLKRLDEYLVALKRRMGKSRVVFPFEGKLNFVSKKKKNGLTDYNSKTRWICIPLRH
jgi:GntR family transcriptional repressor for pyruvate dehydrogenase complex